MNRILFKEQLAAEVFRFQIEAPLIAAGRKPGQFVILQQDTEFGERIPLTIADADPAKGTISVIFQRVGDGTQRLAELEAGDCITNLVGPLGRPTHIDKFGLVVCVGGGIGVAPLYPIAQAMKAAGNRVVVILGARKKSLLILTDEMRAIADEVLICTDDGSAGRKGLVTEPLGAETLITVRIGAAEMVARVPADFHQSPGSPLALHVDPRKLHLFDRRGGQALA